MVASHGIESKGGTLVAPPISPKAVNASEEFLGQRDDDARRASHVAESVLVIVLATSPTSSAPLARRRATVSSTLSTVNMTLRRPSAFGGAIAGSISTSFETSSSIQVT